MNQARYNTGDHLTKKTDPFAFYTNLLLHIVDEKVVKTRDWYSLNVLESLENETKTLRHLTIILIALTAVLAVLTGLLVLGLRG